MFQLPSVGQPVCAACTVWSLGALPLQGGTPAAGGGKIGGKAGNKGKGNGKSFSGLGKGKGWEAYLIDGFEDVLGLDASEESLAVPLPPGAVPNLSAEEAKQLSELHTKGGDEALSSKCKQISLSLERAVKPIGVSP